MIGAWFCSAPRNKTKLLQKLGVPLGALSGMAPYYIPSFMGSPSVPALEKLGTA